MKQTMNHAETLKDHRLERARKTPDENKRIEKAAIRCRQRVYRRV